MKVDLPRQPMMGRGRLEPGVAFLMELLLLATLLLATATAQRRDGEFQSLMFVGMFCLDLNILKGKFNPSIHSQLS